MLVALIECVLGVAWFGSFLKVHPYHQHTTHFQVVEVTQAGVMGDAVAEPSKAEQPRLTMDEGAQLSMLAEVGDWRDTIPLYASASLVIRFVA